MRIHDQYKKIIFYTLVKIISNVKLKTIPFATASKRIKGFKKFNKSARFVHWKLQKIVGRSWRSKWMGKHLMFVDLKTIFLRWQYSANWSTYSIQSLPKFQFLRFWGRNWQANSKIHTEVQEIQNHQNNLEKEEQSYRTYSSQFQDFFKKLQ